MKFTSILGLGLISSTVLLLNSPIKADASTGYYAEGNSIRSIDGSATPENVIEYYENILPKTYSTIQTTRYIDGEEPITFTDDSLAPYAVAVPDGTWDVKEVKASTGQTYDVEKKEGVYNTLVNVTMYIYGKIAGTFGGFVLDGVSLVSGQIDKTKGASTRTYVSYTHKYKEVSIYEEWKNQWVQWFEAQRIEEFKHAHNSWFNPNWGSVQTKAVDYNTTPHRVTNTANYNNTTNLLRLAKQNRSYGYNYNGWEIASKSNLK